MKPTSRVERKVNRLVMRYLAHIAKAERFARRANVEIEKWERQNLAERATRIPLARGDLEIVPEGIRTSDAKPTDVPPWCEHDKPARMCADCTPVPDDVGDPRV